MHFLLRQKDDSITGADADGSESTGFDGFECVLNLIESTLVAEDGDVVFRSLSRFTHYLKTI